MTSPAMAAAIPITILRSPLTRPRRKLTIMRTRRTMRGGIDLEPGQSLFHELNQVLPGCPFEIGTRVGQDGNGAVIRNDSQDFDQADRPLGHEGGPFLEEIVPVENISSIKEVRPLKILLEGRGIPFLSLVARSRA